MLGCELDPDSLSHYLIRAAIRCVSPEASADPLVRCGLCEPSVHASKFVACMFSVYHSLKHKFNCLFEASRYDNMDYHTHFVFFVQSLSAEAGLRHVSRALFSLSALDDYSFQMTYIHSPARWMCKSSLLWPQVFVLGKGFRLHLKVRLIMS